MLTAPSTVPPSDTTPTSLASPGELKRKSVRGGVITVVSQAANAGMTLISTMILARFLSPQDYGLMAMVLAVTAFAGLFRDLGLSAAAVQKRTLSCAEQSNLFWLNLAVGTALTLGLALAAPLVARFYGKPEVLAVTLVLSATFLITSLGTQSGAALVRHLRFGRQAVATVSGAALTLLVAVFLARQDFGYWSLVWSRLAGQLATTILLLLLSPFRPTWPDRTVRMRGLLRFGLNVTGFELVNYFHRNLDNILIGRFCGVEALGLYNRAYTLLMFPISQVRGPVNAVAFPALSRSQEQPELLRAYYIRATSLIALLSMPLTVFLFASSEPLVQLALGPAWARVSPIFSLLAVAAFLQPAAGFAGSLMLALGQGGRYFQVGLGTTLVFALSFAVGLPWGPRGVALAYAVANYLTLWPTLTWAFRDSPVRFADFVDACAFPALMSAAALAVLLAARPLLADSAVALQVSALVGLQLAVCGLALAFTPAGRRHAALIRGLFRGKALPGDLPGAPRR